MVGSGFATRLTLLTILPATVGADAVLLAINGLFEFTL
jgi:hypothetical protein